jgi:hypothetical protein
MIRWIEEELEEIQKKINKIEDEDSNYMQNEKWKILRHRQDGLYDLKRRELEDEQCM